MNREALVALARRGGVGVGPAGVEGQLEHRVGGPGIEVAGEELRKFRRVDRRFGEDEFHLLLAGPLAHVIEVRVDDPELAPGGAFAQAQPVHMAGPGRLPR